MKRILRWLIPAALAALVLVPFLGGRRAAPGAGTAAAVERLAALEEADPDDVVRVIRQQQKARMDAQKAEMREKLENGEADPWSMMQDFVILGDSRPAGFYYYGFFPRDRVQADAGDTIRVIPERMEDIAALQPARVYLSFGINDINIGFWDSPAEYTAEFKDVIAQLRERMPELEIYINSILPVQDFALSQGAAWPRVPEYNEALRAMCEECGAVYVDNDGIVAEHADLYDEDGIHFQKEFYTYWVTNLVIATWYPETETEVAWTE